MATVKDLYNELRTAAINYRRLRTSQSRETFMIAYRAAQRAGVPFIDQDYADLLKAPSTPYREPAHQPRRPKKRQSEFEWENEFELEAAGAVTDEQWRSLGQAHDDVQSSTGEQRMKAIYRYVSRYHPVQQKLSKRRESMPQKYRALFTKVWPEFQAKHHAVQRSRGIGQAEAELEMMLTRAGL